MSSPQPAVASGLVDPSSTRATEPVLQSPEHWSDQPLSRDDADSALGDDAASSTASISSSIIDYRRINGRTYHSDRGQNVYWGANDDAQQEVLDIQHHVFTLCQDGKTHLAPLNNNIKKALDIGTGTGIWAIDFGDQFPDTQVIGTDLSPIQPSWVPSNVQFEIDDFTQDWTFAEESFDYVHMRWLIGTVTNWTELFKKAYRVLKPGGWIESFECDGRFESDDGTVTNDTAASQWGLIFREGAKKLGSTASFTVVSDGVQRSSIEEAGFKDVQQKLFKVPISPWPKDKKYKEIGQFSHVALFRDIEGAMGYPALQLGWSQEQIHVYAAHLRKEIRSREVHAHYLCGAVWAQKPLDG